MTQDELLAREAIRDTIARYTTAGDRLRVEDFAGCFCEDGTIESPHRDPTSAFRYEGREAIRAWQQRWLDRARSGVGVHSATFVRHHLTTSRIDLTGPDTAAASTYWIAWTDIGADHAGTYRDTFRKEGGRWLIAQRLVFEDWRSPDSLFGETVVNSR